MPEMSEPAVIAQLPLFEKKRPVATRLKLNGLSNDDLAALPLNTKIYVLVEARVEEVAHYNDPKAGLLRVHKARILRHCPQDEELSRKILDEFEGTPQMSADDDPLGALSEDDTVPADA